MSDLYEIATKYRSAIEEAIHNGEIQEMASFPIGCCGMASDLLQRYLFEQGIFTWYVSGRHGYGIDSESHAWLETTDGTIIDITGDQYKYKKLKFKTPVYVGVLADGFHDRFELDEPVAYERKEDPLGINRKAEIRYKTVMKYINKIC